MSKETVTTVTTTTTTTTKQPKKRKEKKTTTVVLIILALFLLAFIVTMIVIFCVVGSVPDTLIQCVLGGSGVEVFILGAIKVSKVIKSESNPAKTDGNSPKNPDFGTESENEEMEVDLNDADDC